jgi:hypothetical protein
VYSIIGSRHGNQWGQLSGKIPHLNGLCIIFFNRFWS